MIDRATVIISTVLTLYIIWRAAKLDRLLPWFETKWLYDQAQKKLADAKDALARRRGNDPLAARASMQAGAARRQGFPGSPLP